MQDSSAWEIVHGHRGWAEGLGEATFPGERGPDIMSDCGHLCCEIPSNSYHAHIGPPSICQQCASASATVSASPGSASGPEPAVIGADVAADRGAAVVGTRSESHVLGRIVADVVARVVPQIPGLPVETELTELVASHALAVYAAGLVDPDVQVLGERERRTVLAARVGLALAFPVSA
jgi:hypothetical protein